jgi:hypothetical protein
MAKRIGDALAVETNDGVMDGLVEGGDVWVGEAMGLKLALDRLDFIEFGGVFRQPLDGEPVCGRPGRTTQRLLDRTIVLDRHDGFRRRPDCGPKRQSSCSRFAMKSLLRPGRYGRSVGA